MIRKEKPMKSILMLVMIFALWMAMISGCSNADKSNSSQPLSVSTPSPKAVTTPVPATPVPATPQPAPQIDGKITKQELGGEWAFTVDDGVLACDGKNGVGAVTFTSGGKTYALNGAAKQTNKYEPVDSIWADDPSIKGAKKDIGSTIQRGLKLCK
jgi:hypothetical protein